MLHAEVLADTRLHGCFLKFVAPAGVFWKHSRGSKTALESLLADTFSSLIILSCIEQPCWDLPVGFGLSREWQLCIEVTMQY